MPARCGSGSGRGVFYHGEKEIFDREIGHPNTDGHPEITLTRLAEEGNIVTSEDSVKAKPKDGNTPDAECCDVFHFTKGKINRLATYQMFNK